MRELNKKELLEISGGASLFTAAFFNAASRAATTIFNLGRSLGTSIVRALNGNYCTASK